MTTGVGSRTATSARVAQGTEDVNFTLPNNTDPIILGCGVEDNGDRIRPADGNSFLQFRTGADAFVNVASATGAVRMTTATNLTDTTAVTAGERLTVGGAGAFIDGREVEVNGQQPAAEVRDAHTEWQFGLDFSNAVASTTYDFRVAWQDKNGITNVNYISIITTTAAGAEAALTGVSSTSAVGSVNNVLALALTGVLATGSVGSVSPNVSVALTGVQATSAVGSVGFTKSGSLALTGVQATGAVGSVGFTESGSTGITGVSATSAVGSVGVSIGGSATLTGASATGSVGSVSPSTDVAITGVASVGAVGTVSPSTSVPIIGVAGTSAVGTVTASSASGATLSGVSATSAVGSLGVTKSGSLALSGVEATGAVGDVDADYSGSLTGVSSAASVGNVSGNISVPLSGVSGTSAVGVVGFAESGTVALTGVAATGAVGSVTASAGAGASLTGVEATSAVGSLAFTKSGTVALTGVVGTSGVGSVVAGAAVSANFYVGGQVLINRADTSAPIFLAVDNTGGVTGLTVTVQIRDGATSTSYLDFNDLTFKTSAWTQKSLTLNEIGGGHYSNALNVSLITNLPTTSHLAVEYDIAGSVVGVANSTLTFNLPSESTMWAHALTEDYPVDGQSSATPTQFLYAVNQMLSEFERTGILVSIKKRDGTQAFELTLDSATAPTSTTQSA